MKMVRWALANDNLAIRRYIVEQAVLLEARFAAEEAGG